MVERSMELEHEPGCCCQFNPSVEDSPEIGVRLVSECCPVHNYNPTDRSDCGCFAHVCPYESRGKALKEVHHE